MRGDACIATVTKAAATIMASPGWTDEELPHVLMTQAMIFVTSG
jgi:hypothetical protein